MTGECSVINGSICAKTKEERMEILHVCSKGILFTDLCCLRPSRPRFFPLPSSRNPHGKAFNPISSFLWETSFCSHKTSLTRPWDTTIIYNLRDDRIWNGMKAAGWWYPFQRRRRRTPLPVWGNAGRKSLVRSYESCFSIPQFSSVCLMLEQQLS